MGWFPQNTNYLNKAGPINVLTNSNNKSSFYQTSANNSGINDNSGLPVSSQPSTSNNGQNRVIGFFEAKSVCTGVNIVVYLQ